MSDRTTAHYQGIMIEERITFVRQGRTNGDIKA